MRPDHFFDDAVEFIFMITIKTSCHTCEMDILSQSKFKHQILMSPKNDNSKSIRSKAAAAKKTITASATDSNAWMMTRSKIRALSQKEVQNTLASKTSSFTKQDVESLSIGFDNEVHYENPMYESSMAEDSNASPISPVMMIGMLISKEQRANLTRPVESLAKRTQEQEYSIAQ
ncbi:hypothetical protein M9H77_31669 [Catharanthus roseus]|uniref:Uncharacterized protein n=1 Tax=Catharanthus roseus TaxID=4058 RepID=A0ACC0A3F9_CATRO|nr:hypothetical protein M9H77_31669 [Catharanthus roseus]